MQLRMEFSQRATVRLLLTELTGQYPGLDKLVFSAPGILRDLVNILKNGRNIHFLVGLDTPLEDGDTIALFPPVAGGYTSPRFGSISFFRHITKKSWKDGPADLFTALLNYSGTGIIMCTIGIISVIEVP